MGFSRSACLVALMTCQLPLGYAQTINTSCTLYPTAAFCTSTSGDGGAAAATVARQQQYETGQAAGEAVGMSIFRAYFPHWRRKYCSKHPDLPFYYSNGSGDSISGTCPSLQGLSNEAAAAFVSKHRNAVTSAEQAIAIDKYIAQNNLPPWEPKSYDKAYKAVGTPMDSASHQPATGTGRIAPTPDVFFWFDEPPPTPGSPLIDVLITPRAYDGALAILRQARQGNTSVQAGMSVLDTDYHPPSTNLASWKKSNTGAAVTVFYWSGEEVRDGSAVMHLAMTPRAFQQAVALSLQSELRSTAAGTK